MDFLCMYDLYMDIHFSIVVPAVQYVHLKFNHDYDQLTLILTLPNCINPNQCSKNGKI